MRSIAFPRARSATETTSIPIAPEPYAAASRSGNPRRSADSDVQRGPRAVDRAEGGKSNRGARPSSERSASLTPGKVERGPGCLASALDPRIVWKSSERSGATGDAGVAHDEPVAVELDVRAEGAGSKAHAAISERFVSLARLAELQRRDIDPTHQVLARRFRVQKSVADDREGVEER